MEIKDLKPNTGNVDIVAKVTQKEEPREFEKFGKQGRVCKAIVEDETGNVKLTLWNEDVDKINVGDKVHIQNGWCSEYQGETQLSSGKFGKVEVIEAGAGMDKPQEVFTNSPEMLNPQPPTGEVEEAPSMEDMEETIE
jgi:replication factor A1